MIPKLRIGNNIKTCCIVCFSSPYYILYFYYDIVLKIEILTHNRRIVLIENKTKLKAIYSILALSLSFIRYNCSFERNKITSKFCYYTCSPLTPFKFIFLFPFFKQYTTRYFMLRYFINIIILLFKFSSVS